MNRDRWVDKRIADIPTGAWDNLPGFFFNRGWKARSEPQMHSYWKCSHFAVGRNVGVPQVLCRLPLGSGTREKGRSGQPRPLVVMKGTTAPGPGLAAPAILAS